MQKSLRYKLAFVAAGVFIGVICGAVWLQFRSEEYRVLAQTYLVSQQFDAEGDRDGKVGDTLNAQFGRIRWFHVSKVHVQIFGAPAYVRVLVMRDRDQVPQVEALNFGGVSSPPFLHARINAR